MKTPYDDIIDLPHHVSARHPQMSLYNRAAQFAPFAALSGHDAAIEETARLTEEQRELTQGEREALSRKLNCLLQRNDSPVVEISYFQPDARKSGGRSMGLFVPMFSTSLIPPKPEYRDSTSFSPGVGRRPCRRMRIANSMACTLSTSALNLL